MINRKYSVAEIDALRGAVENKWLFGTYQPTTGNSRAYFNDEKLQAVEALVRTHMLSGHTAEDLYESEQPKQPAQTRTDSEGK